MIVSVFARGNQFLREGRLEEAIASYQKAIELNPQFAWSYQNLGDALEKVGRRDEAIAVFRRSVANCPESPWPFYKLGVILGQQGKFQEGVGYLRRAIELKNDVPEFYLGLGTGLVKLGQWSQAVDCINQAVGMWGETVGTLYGMSLQAEADFYLAEAKSGQGQWSEAVEFYGRSWEVSQGRVDCCMGWAKALGKLGRWSEAVELYRQLWKTDEDSLPPQTMVFISSELFKLDAFSEAASCLEKVLKIHPNYPGALREQKNQYCYHAYSSWLMETVEGISDWHKADGLLTCPDWSTAAKLCQQFMNTDSRKNSLGTFREYVRTNLLLAEECWERKDTHNAKIVLQRTIESFGKYLPVSMVNSLIKSVDAIRGNQINSSEELTKNIQNQICAINADVLSLDEWLCLYDVLNWNGLFKCGLVARQKGIQQAYQQADSKLNNAESLRIGAMAAIDRADFKIADKYIDRLSAIGFNGQKFAELRAYKCLQEGDLKGFRKLWPHQAKSVDVLFQQYIRGKSVAIVGPAPTGVADGEEINSFDVVIRFNYRGLDSMPDAREYGTKTNISLYNAHTIRYLIAQNKLGVLSELDFCLIRRPRYDLDSLGWDKNKIRLIYESDNIFYKSLNGVPAVLFDVLLQGAGKVKLFKSNFYLASQQHSEKYRGRDEANFAGFPLRKIQPVVANHDLISQMSFTRNLWKAGLIVVDEECAEVLKLSDEDYLSSLANYYCRNTAEMLGKRKLLSKPHNIPHFVLVSHHPINHSISVCASVYNFFIGPQRIKDLAGFLSVKESLDNFKRNYLEIVKPGKTLLFNGLTSLLCEQSVFALTKALSNQTPIFVYFHETAWNFRYLFHHHKNYVSSITQLLRKCDVNYLVTSSQAFHLVAFLFGVSWEKIKIVYELVDFSKFNPDLGERTTIKGQRNINLISAGTLSQRKGIDLFMVISNKLTSYNKQQINYLWYSASKGKHHYEDRNIKQSNVQWMPFSKDFNQVLLNATALLLTSRDDPAPLVALEALACDLPVFCFQTTGIREIVTPEFICDSVDDMINKIQSFLDKRDNYPQGFFRAIANSYNAGAFCERAFGKHDVQGIITQIPDYDFTQDSINLHSINEKYKKLSLEARQILERAAHSVDYLTTQIKSVNIASKQPENPKRVVIVGNSPNVLEQKLGEYIDMCGEVVRINNFVTKGYEKFIGSKTTRAFISFACGPANEELRQLYPDKIYLTRCHKFQESDVPFLRDRMLNKKNSVGFEPTCLHLLDPFMYYDRLRYLLNLGENMWTTTGTVAIQWAIDNFKATHEIYIYGFSFYKESQDNKLTRYFPGHTKKDNHHDFEAEKNYVKSLIDKKQIKYLSDMIV